MVSVWIPVITAFSALFGVVVGQYWQGRREERRWWWERELDAEHREEQRLRDREMWARDDRNRFMDQKRQIYVDYHTCAYNISVLIIDTGRRMRESQSATDNPDLGSGDFLDSLDFAKKFTEKYDELKVIRNYIRLMAPAEVLTAVTRIDEILIPVIDRFYDNGMQAAPEIWSNLRTARFELFDVMRRDLNPGGSMLPDGTIPQFVSEAKAETWTG